MKVTLHCECSATRTDIHVNNTQSHVHYRRSWIQTGVPVH